MAGNALDRAEAKIAINKAENGLEVICRNINEIANSVYNLNTAFRGNLQSKVTKVFVSYHRLIGECMDSFGGDNKHIFIDYHKGLVALINAGADGDDIHPVIDKHATQPINEVYTQAPYGIKDYNFAVQKVELLQAAVNKFTSSTDEVIAAYQKLWWLADDAGNQAIKDKAHEAAEKVRALIADYGTQFKAINESFKACIQENEAQQNISVEELESRANELYNMLQSVDFRTISADQDALQAIASSWRNSL